MPAAPPDPDRLLPRIRAGLDKLPLSEAQKARITPRLLRDARFLDNSGGREDAGQIRPDSPFFDFAAKIGDVAGRFAAEGLTVAGYVRAASKQPQLFYQSTA